MTIDELLVDFNEMGFAPTTLCENPDEYACKWKRQLLAEIERLIEECNQQAEELAKEQEACVECELDHEWKLFERNIEIDRLRAEKKNVIKEFAKKHREMMLLFCDDDDQISLKVCEYDANTNDLVKEMAGEIDE